MVTLQQVHCNSHDSFSRIVVLNAVTLKQLHTMHHPHNISCENLVYSPDGHLLTGYSCQLNCIVSWDLQTGGVISNVSTQEYGLCDSMSYSGCGTMLGNLFGSKIIIYNVLSGLIVNAFNLLL